MFIIPNCVVQIKDLKGKEQTDTDSASPPSTNKETGDDPARSGSSLGQTGSSGEDFVMVESLKTPFASGDGDPSHDVGVFFRECQSAPLSLQSFNRTTAAGAAAQEIGTQLEQFEKDMQAYDDLVQSLCLDPDVDSKP